MCPFQPTQSTRKWKIMKQNYVAYNGLTAMAINYYSDFFPKYLRSLLTYYECKKNSVCLLSEQIRYYLYLF